MDKKIIGKNTRAILYGENMSRKELLGCTELTTIELASAVGWLARKDKVKTSKINLIFQCLPHPYAPSN